MKVEITGVSTALDSIMALGIAAYLKGIGVDVVESSESQKASPATVAAVEEPKSFAAGKKMKPAKTVRESRAVKKSAPVPSEAPRVTIRSRIVEFLKTGPKTSLQVGQLVGKDAHDAGQHLYLLTRDKLAVRNEDTNTWSLA